MKKIKDFSKLKRGDFINLGSERDRFKTKWWLIFKIKRVMRNQERISFEGVWEGNRGYEGVNHLFTRNTLEWKTLQDYKAEKLNLKEVAEVKLKITEANI